MEVLETLPQVLVNKMEVWDEFVLELNKELDQVKEVVAEGGASNFGEYQNLVGYNKGLMFSRTKFTSIITRRNHGLNDEEDD